MKRLSSEDLRLFELVTSIIFSNPFTVDRQDIEQRLAPYGSPDKMVLAEDHHHLFGLVVPILERRITELQQEGFVQITQLSGSDRRLMENALLFLVFHRHVENFDTLIRNQLEGRGNEVKAPFAESLLAQLMTWGFTKKEALRYLALLYQCRRGYYFIGKGLVGDSESMRQLRKALWNSVFTFDARQYADFLWNKMEDFSTLIVGETGTGKGSAAMAMGRSGLILYDESRQCFASSFSDACVAINLSQYPETLIESELFGHRKGAFTGAISDQKGILDQCKPNGLLFLDEIGEVSVPVQIKLLNVLQDRVYASVGSHDKKAFYGRVVAATNQSIGELRQKGKFRDDFFYRLCSDVIQLPTLRQRILENPAELAQLTQLQIDKMTRISAPKTKNISQSAHPLQNQQSSPELCEWVLWQLQKSLPENYTWPGNVRELEQAVRQIFIKASYSGDPFFRNQLKSPDSPEKLTARQVLDRHCARLYEHTNTYEAVANIVQLDRRTVKKHVEAYWNESDNHPTHR